MEDRALMNTWLRSIIGGLLALVGTAVAVPQVGAETASLELKRLDAKGRGISIDSKGEFLMRLTRSQGFYMQIQDGDSSTVMRDPQKETFERLVKKQPEKYQAKQPFRGVAKLGSDEYLFVFDLADDKSNGFDRLYFDRNHNGDLTDDEVLKAETSNRSSGSYSYVQSYFPRVDLTVNADGAKVDYSFCFQIYTNKSKEYSYSSAALQPLAYREGKITLDGKERRVVLVDFNSNGRFDDAMNINDDMRMADGRVYPHSGDVLMVDPNVEAALRRITVEVTPGSGRYNVSKLVAIDGRFYDLKITPAGDKVTMTPSKAALGNVTNPNETFTAIVYGDKGFVQIAGEKDKPCALPEGEWKLLNYTIDISADKAKELAKKKDEAKKSDEKKDAKKSADKAPDKKKGEEKKSSLLGALSKAILGSSGASPEAVLLPSDGPSYVAACATRDYKAVKVTAGKTVALPFGPPYKPTVNTQFYRPDRKQVDLELSLIGSAGEICTDMRVKGGRPGAPHFTIKKPDGKTEVEGDFRYG